MLKIEGKDIYLEYTEIEDAEFLHSLRTDPALSKYLSPVGPGVLEQIEWLRRYKEREKNKIEHYFIIHLKNCEKIGTIRIYDFKKDSFCPGSLIVKQNAPIYTALEALLSVYDFSFSHLGFNQAHFDVVKDNTRVVQFHLNFGAKIVSQDDCSYFFILKREVFERAKIKFKRFYQPIKIVGS
jgi:RimJ/RimL family protein N-acetyltransferase